MARQNLRVLESEISSYCDCTIEDVRQQAQTLGDRAAFLLGGPADLPPIWSVFIGEIAYNLRSSLDHLIWQLVIHNGNIPTKHNQFPIFANKIKYDKAAKRYLKGVCLHSCKLIEESQPFHKVNREGAYLWILHSICNIDKHRHLNLVDHYSRISVNVREDVELDLSSKGLSEGCGVMQHHNVELDVSLEVCFMEKELQKTSFGWATIVDNSPNPYFSVVSTLSGCLNSVNAIVNNLRPS